MLIWCYTVGMKSEKEMKKAKLIYNKQSLKRRKRLGYAKICRQVPVAFTHKVDAYIAQMSRDWDEIREEMK